MRPTNRFIISALLVYLLGSCSAPQCDTAKVHLWNDGKQPAPYRVSVKCTKDGQTHTLHLLKSKTRVVQ